ncbi:hypothetical protein [Acinetobacter dispersus]|uniref:Uncharacterized protein n=1 Tax=Acinetobacter dispersus TaxID=70348 RepID=N9MQ15_9GAMM|nr:hypothetical protein [Acinetobacter dispersus]ENW92029.1 hypothetical protein F904_01967 [Acinetobacter dispersus]
MDNWKYALIASVVTMFGMALVALLSRFRLWKVSLSIFLVSSIGFCIIGGLGRRSENHGFDGSWGAHGVLMEFLNLETIIISLGVGAFITLIFFLSILLSDNR